MLLHAGRHRPRMLPLQQLQGRKKGKGRGAGVDLADVAQLVPGLADPLLAGAVDPVLHLRQPSFHVLAIGEGAALAAQQQLVEQLHVDKAEQLLEQLLDQEGRHVVALQRVQQLVEHAQHVAPVRAELRHRGACRAGQQPLSSVLQVRAKLS